MSSEARGRGGFGRGRGGPRGRRGPRRGARNEEKEWYDPIKHASALANSTSGNP
jgi:hypothetical protein